METEDLIECPERIIAQFTVPGIPIAQPRQRVAVRGKHAVNYTPSKHPVNVFKAATQISAVGAYKGKPHDGPIELCVLFVLTRPKAKFWKTKPTPREWHKKTPDADNLAKALKDALTGTLWLDDSQVCILKAMKVVASGEEQPHTEVVVSRLDGLDPFGPVTTSGDTGKYTHPGGVSRGLRTEKSGYQGRGCRHGRAHGHRHSKSPQRIGNASDS